MPQKTRNLKSFFSLIILISASLSFEYRFSQQIAHSLLDAQVSDIVMMDEDKMAIIKDNKEGRKIYIMQGEQYNIITKEIQIGNQILNLDVTTNQIYVNDGQQIKELQMINQNETLLNTTQTGFAIINQTCVIASTLTNYTMTLTAVNLDTKEFYKKIYQDEREITSQLFSAIKLIDKDTLACFANSHLFIINPNNLQIKQKIQVTQRSTLHEATISSLYQKVGNKLQNTIVIKNLQKIYVIVYNDLTKLYEKVNQYFDEKPQSFQLSDFSKGVSFNQADILRWTNLSQDNIVSTEHNFTLFDQQLVIATSNSQDLFVTYYFPYYEKPQSTYVSFLKFNRTNYKIQNLTQHTISLGKYVRPVPYSGRFTNDDKYIFMRIREGINFQEFFYIARIDVEQHNIISILQKVDNSTEKWNCTDFGIIDSQLFVVLCNCSSNTSSPNKLYYQIRLYSAGNLQILDTYNITTQNFYQTSLKANPNYNYTFIVQIAINQSSSSCISHVFMIQNNRILNTNISTNNLSIYSLDACIYLVSQFTQDEETRDRRYVAIINISNFQMIKKIRQISSHQQIEFIQKNILIIRDGRFGQVNLYSVYDLKKIRSSDDQWQLGKFTDNSYITAFVLANFKLFVNAHPKQNSLKIIRDLTRYPIQGQVIAMSNQSTCNGYIYEITKNVSDCNKIYFISQARVQNIDHMYFNVFKDCPPYLQATRASLNFDLRCIQLNLIPKISSTKEYIIFSHYDYCKSQYSNIIDLRDINQINKSISENVGQNIKIYDADVTSRQQIILATKSGLFLRKLKPKLSKHTYSFEKISAFDTNDKGCAILAGNSIEQNKKIKFVYYKNKMINTYIQAQSKLKSVKIVAIDQNCKHFIAYQQNKSLIQLWNITTKNGQQNGIQKWKDINIGEAGIQKIILNKNYQIIFKTQKGIIIQNILENCENVKYELSENIYSKNIKQAINKDGNLLAFSLDGKRVSIISLVDMKQIGSFNIQAANQRQSKITVLGFSQNNSLFIILNDQTLRTVIPIFQQQKNMEETNNQRVLQIVILITFITIFVFLTIVFSVFKKRTLFKQEHLLRNQIANHKILQNQ